MDSGRKLRRGIPVDPAFFAPEFMLFHLGLESVGDKAVRVLTSLD